ncbi:hypothetical protein ACJQ57_003519 [Escherichia coli]
MMKIRRITPGNPTSGKRCPDCGSHDTIPWADGWMCRDCGVSGAKITVICKGGSHGILECNRETA